MPSSVERTTEPAAPVSALALGTGSGDELFELKFRVLQLSSQLADAKRAQIEAELETKLATMRVEYRVREALEGAPSSELWGPAGLIAATMRCVHALQSSEVFPNDCGEPRPGGSA